MGYYREKGVVFNFKLTGEFKDSELKGSLKVGKKLIKIYCKRKDNDSSINALYVAPSTTTLYAGRWGTIIPPASTYVANIAPADMRGRYMSIFGLTWAFGQGVGPVLGGLLNDNFGPRSIWLGGMMIGLLSAFGLFLLARRAAPPAPIPQPDTP